MIIKHIDPLLDEGQFLVRHARLLGRHEGLFFVGGRAIEHRFARLPRHQGLAPVPALDRHPVAGQVETALFLVGVVAAETPVLHDRKDVVLPRHFRVVRGRRSAQGQDTRDASG